MLKLFKTFVKKIFYKIYHFDERSLNFSPYDAYNSFGMVKPKKKKQELTYYASPILPNRKCIRNSRIKYGFNPGDNVETIFYKIEYYYTNQETTFSELDEDAENDKIKSVGIMKIHH